MTTAFKKGDKVVYGRRNGEQTNGTVVKVNKKSLKVRQDESRGTLKGHRVGTVWNVPPSLCRHAIGTTPEVTPEPPKPKRPDAEIMRDIVGVYVDLSPENLTCDGECSFTQVKRRRAACNRSLKALFQEIGRKVNEDETTSDSALEC